jgi:hypothetical protein
MVEVQKLNPNKLLLLMQKYVYCVCIVFLIHVIAKAAKHPTFVNTEFWRKCTWD